MDHRRITLIAGHYGSGKTNIAVNWARHLKGLGERVVLADMDIVNPYYRAKDSEEDMEREGIDMISSFFANSNVDLPAVPDAVYSIVDDRTRCAVVDVGGDDRGALALGRLVPKIVEEGDFELLLVINRYRPLTRDAASTLEVIREIEEACRLKVTALVNNSNLGADTTAETVLASLGYAAEVSAAAGVPLKMTTVQRSLYEELEGKIPDLFPLTLQKRPTE